MEEKKNEFIGPKIGFKVLGAYNRLFLNMVLRTGLCTSSSDKYIEC